MLVLRYLVKLVKVLNSDTSATALALAFALGMFLGLVPLLTLQAFAALAVLLFFRVHFAAAFVTFGVFRLVALAAAGLFDRTGVALLESPALQGLWAWLYNAPVLFLCRTNHSITLGATLFAVALFLPVLFGSRALVTLYRARFNEWLSQFGLVNAFRASKLYRAWEWFDSPFKGGA